MSKTFTLDNFREAAERKYGSMLIEMGDDVLTLRNALRLSSAERKELTSSQDAAEDNDDEEGAIESLRNVIRVAAQEKKLAEDFLALVGDDAAVLMAVIEEYMGSTETGEASPSES